MYHRLPPPKCRHLLSKSGGGLADIATCPQPFAIKRQTWGRLACSGSTMAVLFGSQALLMKWKELLGVLMKPMPQVGYAFAIIHHMPVVLLLPGVGEGRQKYTRFRTSSPGRGQVIF